MFSNQTDISSDHVKGRNYLVAFLAGALTGIAWWIIIDILVRSTEPLFSRWNLLPGIAITLMLILVHFIPDAAMSDDSGMPTMFSSSSTFCESQQCARISIFLVFVIIFSAVVASAWIFIGSYGTTDRLERKSARVQWFGIGNMVFTILLAVAALLSRFGRKDTDSLMNF